MSAATARNVTRNLIVADHVEVARSIWARFWGLMFRKGLGRDEALLIDPCSSVHTMFMRFPIDIVFLDAENRVVKITQDLRPWRIGLASGSKRVLEMPSGTVAKCGLAVGDTVVFAYD